ncbi:LysR family transcriptional regulator [Pseudoalteromonas sp. MMG013]|uniref:LysR family transcriptional regulator n=1 Tax=unclassified Pseudoalteromonas TaxID=194690 RepID=UPI001B3642DD|nr:MULTISPECIES: LysR family transcriptional regulator [unclassified Pseudoalteromonas]MBQ4852103.1 LysR family transcriptional regulator [Pseudoalteromonas sp. MMG012]MBQ4862382.1 LysR family transcriptional regulator [Pseudoalteromonas sp. MMG013]
MSGLHKLEIKQLRILSELLALQNLSKVAQKVGLTQQAISEQLKKLRDILDDRLFVRQGNKMVPTPRALALEAPIAEVLVQLEDIVKPEHFEPATYQGVFSISATDYATQALLPEVLSIVRAQAPSLKLIVQDFASDNVVELMSSGQLDLLISFPDFIPDNLPYELLFAEQHLCVASRQSSLNQNTLSIADIAKQPQLVVSPSRANLKGSHDQWFANLGLKRNIIMSVPNFSSVPDLLYATDLIAFFPSRLLPNNKVSILEVEALPPPFEVIVAWHPRSSQSKIHQWLIEQLRLVINQPRTIE